MKFLKNHIMVVSAVLLTAAILIITLTVFSQSTNFLIEQYTRMYLEENVRAVAAVFNTKLNDQLVMLDSQVRYFEDIDMTDYNTVKKTIMSTKGIGAFKTIGVANTAGTTTNYNGKSSGNIMLNDYFREAMTGVSAISSTTSIDEDGDEVLVVAIPIMKNGKAAGVLYGTFTKEILSTLVDTVSFAESGENLLLDDDGSVLAYTSEADSIGGEKMNFFESTGIDPNSEERFFSYDRDGKEMLAVLMPVGVHGWQFGTVLPRSVTYELGETISANVILVMIAVILAFLLLFASILFLIKRINLMATEKEKLGAELGIATKIQADMLPSVFPDQDNFGIYATMTPAKHVGGDFYDYFMIDNEHVGLVMADVSGKGVPAALFMVIAKTLIKDRSKMGGTPAHILQDVNDQLCENNASGLFVTVWFGIVDLTSGVLTVANAGHEYPALRRAEGQFELVLSDNCPPLATMAGMEYTNEVIVLKPGDSVFLYTDGVPEAKSPDALRYGTDRMLEVLNREPGADARMLLGDLKKDIDGFAGGLDPFDDITMLHFRYGSRPE